MRSRMILILALVAPLVACKKEQPPKPAPVEQSQAPDEPGTR